jgi:hypothetical protein
VEYADAIGSLKRLVTNLLSQLVGHLKFTIASFPSFQRYFKYDDGSQGREISLKDLSKVTGLPNTNVVFFRDDPFFWAVYQLQRVGIPGSMVETRRAFYLELIDDHLLNADAKETGRLDPRAYQYLADMAGMDSVLEALNLHCPNIPVLDNAASVRTQGDRPTWANCLKNPIPVSNQEDKEPTAKMGEDLEAFFRNGYVNL